MSQPTTQLNTQENPVIRLDMNTVQGLEGLQRAARLFSSSSLVPKQYQGAQGLANCVIAMNMATRMNADPLMIMQNLDIIYNRPALRAKLLIALFNQCGKYSALRFEEKGKEGSDDWGMRATAIELKTGERLLGTWIDVKLAKANGWYAREGSKWLTMPEQMLRYRAAAWFINTVAPEISMGLQTREEIEDGMNYPDSFTEIIPESTVDPAAPEFETEVIQNPKAPAEPATQPQAPPPAPPISRTNDLKNKL